MVGSSGSALLIHLETASNWNSASPGPVQLLTPSVRKDRMTNLRKKKKKNGGEVNLLFPA